MHLRSILSLLSRLSLAAALLLSHAMCANAAYSYARMQCFAAQTPEFSAPVSVAYWLVIPPYILGILICLGLAHGLRKGASL